MLTGTWLGAPAGDMHLETADGALYARSRGVRYPMFQVDDEYFYIPGLDYMISFAPHERESPHLMHISSNSSLKTAHRARPH